jgi:PPOX class probable F420-dependent enzyme
VAQQVDDPASTVSSGRLSSVERAEAEGRFAAARVAVLGTTGPTGPHLVPVVFALDGDLLYTAVDHKPKRAGRLQRLSNIERDPHVSLLVDEYDEVWNRLWWVRADGTAVVVDAVAEENGLDLLQQKYPQYEGRRPKGPVIVVTVSRWTGWSADG